MVGDSAGIRILVGMGFLLRVLVGLVDAEDVAFGVLEMARSGRISMTRGGDLLRPPASSSPSSELESAGSSVK